MTRQLAHIRHASSEDVPSIVAIHMATFPGFFLTSLGPRFLNLFYTGLVESPIGVLLVADVERSVLGFVGGTTNEAVFFSWLKTRYRGPFIRQAVALSIRRPRHMKRLWRARRRDSEARGFTYDAVLLTVGVDPVGKREGIGGALVRAFSEELAERGADGVHLTTDADNNDGANTFYRNLGFRLRRSYVSPEGRVMNEYQRDFD